MGQQTGFRVAYRTQDGSYVFGTVGEITQKGAYHVKWDDGATTREYSRDVSNMREMALRQSHLDKTPIQPLPFTGVHYVVQRWNGGLRDDYELTVAASFNKLDEAISWCKEQNPATDRGRAIPINLAFTIFAFKGSTQYRKWDGLGGDPDKKGSAYVED